LLKVGFALAPRAQHATYEIPFGVLDRPMRSKIPADKAKFEVPAQRWAALSDSKLGAALLNDSKYGYDCRDHTLRLTLIRSPHYPHPTDPERQTDTAHTDQGEHQFRYALFPFERSWKHGEVVREAGAFNVPVLVHDGAPEKVGPPFLSISKNNIVLSALKKADDGKGYIVRAYEAHGVATNATLTFGRKITSAAECDLQENNEKIVTPKRGSIPARFKPFEIRTWRVLLAGKATLPVPPHSTD
jgi:alpha-mannosidase